MSKIFFGSKSEVVAAIKNQNQDKELVLVSNSIQQAKNYSRFFDADKIFLHDNPDSESIKAIQAQIDSNQGCHFLFFDDDNFDGRLSLISRIKKDNSIYDFSYPVFGDTNLLKRKITNYISCQDYSLSNSCFEWINKNCPSFKIKSKTTKKEKICYDVDKLLRELDKLGSVYDVLLPEHLEDSKFNTEQDIFLFMSYVLEQNTEDAYTSYESLVSSIGEQALLLIVLSQLLFLISVSDCKEKNIYDSNFIVNHTELKDLLGKYLDENWNECQYTVKTQNPIRIKIELGKNTPSTLNLSKMIQYTINTITSTRTNNDIDLCMSIWLHKMLTV